MATKTDELIHSAAEHAEAAFNALQAERAEISRIKSEIQEVQTTPAASFGQLEGEALDAYISAGNFKGVPDVEAIASSKSAKLADLLRELDFRTKAESLLADRERNLRYKAAIEAWQGGRRDKVQAKVIEWAELLLKMGVLGDEIQEECHAHCKEFQVCGIPDSELVPNLANDNRLSPKNFTGEAVGIFRKLHLATGWKPRKQDVGEENFKYITSPK